MGVIFGKKKEDRERTLKQRKRKKDEYTRTSIPVGTGYMFERQHSAARHSTTGQGTAPYGTARRCVALLSYTWAELSCESIFLLFNYSTWYVRQQYQWYDTSNDTSHVGKEQQKHAARPAWHSTAKQYRTARHGTGTALHGAALLS